MFLMTNICSIRLPYFKRKGGKKRGGEGHSPVRDIIDAYFLDAQKVL